MAAVIPNGYYIKARKIQNSDISTQPPHVREIWDWLIKEANHKDNGKFHRGQCLRTYRDILDGLCWFVGYRKMSYTKSQCENALKWLTKQGMITKLKTTRGLIITICNYDLYQNPKNYESHTESYTSATTEPQSSDTINKNEKNERIKEMFEKVCRLYPGKKRGLDTELKDFVKKHKDAADVIELLEPAIKNQIVEKDVLRQRKQFVPEWKHFKTWLSQRCWEEETASLPQNENNISPTMKEILEEKWN